MVNMSTTDFHLILRMPVQFGASLFFGLRWNCVITHFDDILAYSKGADARTHRNHLTQISTAFGMLESS
jgi:hypothetical protein